MQAVIDELDKVVLLLRNKKKLPEFKLKSGKGRGLVFLPFEDDFA